MKLVILAVSFFAAPLCVAFGVDALWGFFNIGHPGLGFAAVCAVALGCAWVPLITAFQRL